MTAVLSVDTLAAASHSWIGERMKNSANLEVNVHRRDNGSYSIVLRCTPPGGDVDISRVGEAQFDFERLRASELDTLPYATLLTNGLFKDPAVALAFGEARSTAQALEASLRIQLGIESNAPELQNLHWETLLDPRDGSYLFAGEQVLFSRYLSSQDWQPVNLRPQTPVTALVVIANPANLSEFQLMPVDVEGELKRAQTSMRGIGMTTLASGGTATLNNLAGRLRDGGHDILYLVCHGSMVDGEPWLWIEDEAGKVARVSGANLVARLKELQQRPRLVVLASCQSAGNADRGNIGAGGALVSLGPRLAGAGIPAVLAMQGSVSMETVARFMPVFFHELLRDGQIDRAMAVARGAISDRPDFWMPVLFMRLKSGRLWDRPSPPAPEPDHGRKRLIGAIAGTLILLAIVVIGWLTLHPRPQPPIFLTGVAPLQQKLALAQQVAQAQSSAGPALIGFGNAEILAWTGELTENGAHKIGYTTTITDSRQTVICQWCTTVAPALGNGAYLAWRGPSPTPTDKIYYSKYDGTTSKFSGGPWPSFPIIHNGTTYAETTASPALALSTNGFPLYAAWTAVTTKGAAIINYATYDWSNQIWNIPTTGQPDVSTNPPALNTGPALAVYNGTLYLAWVTANHKIYYATLPLSPGGYWSSPAPVSIPGLQTSVAPALGVRSWDKPSQLYLAWTTGSTETGYSIDFAELIGSTWASALEPISRASAGVPLKNFSPALDSYTISQGEGCPLLFYFKVAYIVDIPPGKPNINLTTVKSSSSNGSAGCSRPGSFPYTLPAQQPPIVSNAVPQNGPPIPKPYERDKKDNVRFFGREFPGSEFVPPEANWNRCYDACASNPQCRAFTYVKPNATYVMANGRLKTVGPNGSCHLKRDVTNQKPDKCCISIFVRNPTS